MTPMQQFQSIWHRCDSYAALYDYLAKNVKGIVNLEELLRSEWVMRVSAFDFYVHELVAQRALEIFEGKRQDTLVYANFKISLKSFHLLHMAETQTERAAFFDLEVRSQLKRQTFQQPDDVANGIRLFSTIELWNETVQKLGATKKTIDSATKVLKRDLSLIVARRNQIVHEGDLKPGLPREPWPISKADIEFVKATIEKIVGAVDSVLL